MYKVAKMWCWELEGGKGPKQDLSNGRYLKIKDKKKRHNIATFLNNPTKLYILNGFFHKRWFVS